MWYVNKQFEIHIALTQWKIIFHVYKFCHVVVLSLTWATVLYEMLQWSMAEGRQAISSSIILKYGLLGWLSKRRKTVENLVWALKCSYIEVKKLTSSTARFKVSHMIKLNSRVSGPDSCMCLEREKNHNYW